MIQSDSSTTNFESLALRFKDPIQDETKLVSEVERAVRRAMTEMDQADTSQLGISGMTSDAKETAVAQAQGLPEDPCAVLIDGAKNKSSWVWKVGRSEGTTRVEEQGITVTLRPGEGNLAYVRVSHVRHFRRP